MTYRTFDGTSQSETVTLGRYSGSRVGVSDGSTTQGALYFSDDVDTGIYSPSNGQIAFSTNGTERLKIDENGAITFTGSLDFTDARGNTRVGTSAGDTFDGTNAQNNTLIGFEAAKLTLSGVNNTALGYQALYTNIDGDNNTAVGYNALYSFEADTDGHGWNTAVGNDAAKGLSTGTYNTAVGAFALDASLGTGDSNTGLGYNALTDNTSGNNNTAVGREALANNTVGERNVAIGRSALTTNVDGDDSVAIGYEALTNMEPSENAGDNTAIGSYAGQAVNTGIRNVCIGYLGGNTLTSGDNNILIGYNAQPSAVGVDTEIVIGSSVTGKGTNTVSLKGTPYNTADADWGTYSDRRIKKNITDNSKGLDAINQIKIRNFEYKTADEIKTDNPELADTAEVVAKKISGTQVGVVAQELEAILPECVQEESTGVKAVVPTELKWYMVNAIQELSATVTELQNEIKALKAN